jgi:hypothetical protein
MAPPRDHGRRYRERIDAIERTTTSRAIGRPPYQNHLRDKGEVSVRVAVNVVVPRSRDFGKSERLQI